MQTLEVSTTDLQLPTRNRRRKFSSWSDGLYEFECRDGIKFTLRLTGKQADTLEPIIFNLGFVAMNHLGDEGVPQ